MQLFVVLLLASLASTSPIFNKPKDQIHDTPTAQSVNSWHPSKQPEEKKVSSEHNVSEATSKEKPASRNDMIESIKNLETLKDKLVDNKLVDNKADFQNIPKQADKKVLKEADEKVHNQADKKVLKEADEKVHKQPDEKVLNQADKKAPNQADKKAPNQADEKFPKQAEVNVLNQADKKVLNQADLELPDMAAFHLENNEEHVPETTIIPEEEIITFYLDINELIEGFKKLLEKLNKIFPFPQNLQRPAEESAHIQA